MSWAEEQSRRDWERDARFAAEHHWGPRQVIGGGGVLGPSLQNPNPGRHSHHGYAGYVIGAGLVGLWGWRKHVHAKRWALYEESRHDCDVLVNQWIAQGVDWRQAIPKAVEVVNNWKRFEKERYGVPQLFVMPGLIEPAWDPQRCVWVQINITNNTWVQYNAHQHLWVPIPPPDSAWARARANAREAFGIRERPALPPPVASQAVSSLPPPPGY